METRSVFISYARADGPIVLPDVELLRAGGVRVFMDVRDIEYGERWHAVLKRAIDTCERVIVFWSAAAKISEWVEREWRMAVERGKKIVPTLLDDTPLPQELAAFQALRRHPLQVVPSAAGHHLAPAAEPFAPAASRRISLGVGLLAGCSLVALIGGAALWWMFPAAEPPRTTPAAPIPPGPPASTPPVPTANDEPTVFASFLGAHALVWWALAAAVVALAVLVLRRERALKQAVDGLVLEPGATPEGSRSPTATVDTHPAGASTVRDTADRLVEAVFAA